MLVTEVSASLFLNCGGSIEKLDEQNKNEPEKRKLKSLLPWVNANELVEILRILV